VPLPRGVLHAGAVALFALIACRGNTPDRPQPSSMGTAPATTALPPVTLPDLADMDAVVQKQITDQFATVTALVKQRAAPDALAPAYGALGSLLFAALRGTALYRLTLSADGQQVTAREALYAGTYGRLRDVLVAPDGAVYIATSNRDGRGNPSGDDDRILRVKP